MYYTVGGFTLDDTVLPSGEIFWSAPGGNVLYSGVGARLWERDVCLVGPIGEDYPEGNLELLRRKGFSLDGVRKVSNKSFHVWILHEGDGQRQIVYRLDSGRNEHLDPVPEDLPDSIKNAEGIHICPILPSSQAALVDGVKGINAPVFMDIINIHGQIEASLESAKTWNSVDAFLPSIEEVKELLGHMSIRKLLQKIGETAPDVFAIKMGAHGCLVRRSVKEPFYHIPAYPCKVVDSTGAGDAFCGGFMVGYAETEDAIEAAMWGTVSASILIENFGALHALERDSRERDTRLSYIRKNVKSFEEWVDKNN